MPRVKPLTESEKNRARWRRADNDFRRQLGRLLGETGMKQKELAERLGICAGTLRAWARDPGKLPKEKERQLMLLFEQYRIPYDPTWGEEARA